jgi:hypothetical protein
VQNEDYKSGREWKGGVNGDFGNFGNVGDYLPFLAVIWDFKRL